MAKVRINGDTSGYIELASPAAAGSNTITLPSSNGSANQLLKNSGTAGTLAWSTLTEDSSGNLNIDSGTLYVDASNNRVGIGTTSPLSTLHVEGTSRFVASNSALFNGTTGTYSTWLYNGTAVGDIGTGNQVFSGGSNTDFGVTSRSSTSLVFGTNTTERARIDSSGRLLVGTSSARTIEPYGLGTDGQIANTFESVGDTNPGPGLALCSNVTTARMGPYLYFCRSGAATVGSNTVVTNGDNLGTISFAGADGTDVRTRGAAIYCEVDGTPGANDMPGRLVFSTTADGASSPTERMRIDSNGIIYTYGAIGATFYANNSTDLRTFTGSGSNTGGVSIESGADSTSARFHVSFSNPNGVVGSISTSASATSYTTSSDYRLKENTAPLTGAIDRVSQLQVHRFNFIADPDRIVDGFIAHEAQAVVPECVTGTKDEVDEDGNPVYQGIDQSKLVPLLTAALQEAIQKIQQLETLNASFEARLAALEVKP